VAGEFVFFVKPEGGGDEFAGENMGQPVAASTERPPVGMENLS